jgi:peptide/nickel transport system substrate-binding protein
MGYNLRSPLFGDRRVRTAIAHAINKGEIISGVLRGLGTEATGPFPTSSWACDPGVKGPAYDLKKAAELLREAGWKKGKDGLLVNKEGRVFEFKLMTNQGNKAREMCATIIQQQLGKLGIRVKVQVLAWTAFLKFMNERKFDAVLLGWSLSRDPDCYDIWHSSKTGAEEYNFVSYKNDEVDRLLVQGRTTFDLEKRRKIYRRLHALIAADQPYCFLYVPDALVAIDKRFHNIKPEPLGIGYNFIRWYVPKKEQKYKY